MKRFSPQELVDLLQRRRHLLETVNGHSATYYQGLARQTEVAFLAAIGEGGSFVPTPADRVRVSALLETILANGVKQALTRAELDLLEVLRVALNDLAAYHQAAAAVDVFELAPRKIVETFFALERRIEDKTILRVMEPYRTEWAGKFNDRHLTVMRELQRRLIRGQIQGDTYQDIARAMSGPLGTLELNGHQDIEVWSKAFVRTTQQQLYADFSIAASLEAGVAKFVNIGVPDERQSRECWEASQESPMTLADWDKWTASNGRGGRPGDRHVFNCRCNPAGVPDRFVNDDWAQSNEYWEQRVAREEGAAV